MKRAEGEAGADVRRHLRLVSNLAALSRKDGNLLTRPRAMLTDLRVLERRGGRERKAERAAHYRNTRVMVLDLIFFLRFVQAK